MTAEDRADDRNGERAAGECSAATDRAHQPDICGVCPICTAARVLDGARPELLEHLSEAARHLAAALHVAVQAADERDPVARDGDRHPGPATSAHDPGADDPSTAGPTDEGNHGDGGQRGDGGPTIHPRTRQRNTTGGDPRRVRRIDLD